MHLPDITRISRFARLVLGACRTFAASPLEARRRDRVAGWQDENRRGISQDKIHWTGASRLGLHAHDGRLQPGADEQPPPASNRDQKLVADSNRKVPCRPTYNGNQRPGKPPMGRGQSDRGPCFNTLLGGFHGYVHLVVAIIKDLSHLRRQLSHAEWLLKEWNFLFAVIGSSRDVRRIP